jgi:sulfofructose kinase
MAAVIIEHKVGPQFDILGLGCAAADEVLFVDNYPPADGKMRVNRREHHCGGLTATALVAAARLGGKCAFAGALGHDSQSRFVLEYLARERVDTQHAVHRADCAPVRSTIVVDERTKNRTIFYDTNQVRGADAKRPSAGVIRSSRVLLVDHFGMAGMIRAATIARAAGIPVVADFEESDGARFFELLEVVDHLILSKDFACELSKTKSAGQATQALWNKNREAVIVTCGDKGCYYLAKGAQKPELMPAFKITTRDTIGCGDVFHGAYALALARKLELGARIRFASAAAASKAAEPSGPSLKMLKKLLR